MRTSAIDRLLRQARGRGVISFAGGLPAPETFPEAALVDACRSAVAKMGGAPLQYDWPEGRKALREEIAARLRARGARVDADAVLITSGAQDALALAVEALHCDEIEVDGCTYAGALDLFEALRVRATTERAAVRYAMPAVHNPFGWSMTPLSRAAALSADWVIEDDAYAELRFDGGPPTPLLAEAPDRVFHLGTVSKTLSPGLRIGWLVAPPPYQRKVRELKATRDLQASGLSQAVVEQLFASGEYDARLLSLRTFYRARCHALLARLPQLKRVRFTVPVGGFSLWLETDCCEGDEALLRRGLANGVAFDPGILFRAEPWPSGRASLRLSFSALPPSHVQAGLDRLARTLDQARAAAQPQVA